MAVIIAAYAVIALVSSVAPIWCDDKADGDYFLHFAASLAWPLVVAISLPFLLCLGIAKGVRLAKARTVAARTRAAANIRPVTYRDDAGPVRCNECGRRHEA